MQKKLTISIDEQIYYALYHVIGKRKISHFIEDLVRPKVMKQELHKSYKQMAADTIRENEALEWAEGTLGEYHNEAR
ncbi:MAG: addiction module antitoxin [Candidatus Cloacimonetes bacterium]|nr:addiction module antitoxin [Candidatus Cloacimonadota bacterium]MBC8525394.1 addiction module antitoxin [Candidatus Cloacimonadota bacterium]